MAITRAITVMLWDVNSSKINHLGIKPIVGGRPPNENRRIGVEIKMALFFVHEVASELIVFPSVINNTVNMQ